MAVLLAMDLGTEGARVGAFDVDGRPLATASQPYQTTYPRPGWAEQDPRDWWAATVAATRTVLASPEARESGRVIALCVATTASTVAVLDRDAEPLRPALLWMDSRASDEAAFTAEMAVRHPVMRYSGGADAVEWLVPKAMWLARHEPSTYAAAAHMVEAVDYLTYRLTGNWVGSLMNATCKWNYLADVGLPEKLYADLGVADLAEKLPSLVLPVGHPAGELSAEAGAALGIEGSPVVAVGGIDAHISLVGCGPSMPGLVSVVAGTSTVFVTEINEPVFPSTVWGPYPHALHRDRYLVEGGQVSSGSVLRWLCEDVLDLPRGNAAGLWKAAAEVPAAGHGLLALDYFMGNRTPHRDPKLRGAFLGMTVGTTPAQLYRATTEAVAYGTRSVLESFVEAGIPLERVVLSGGIRHNPLWLEVTTDVLGREVELVESDNLTLRAGAAIAATAAGLHPNLSSAAAALASATRTVQPREDDQTHRYDDGYRRYLEATLALRPILHELAALGDPI